MLAKETDQPFDDEEWLFEIKWDGYRAIAEVGQGDVKLYSRNGLSFLGKYPAVEGALSKLNAKAVLDGEIVVLDENGMPSFQALQHYDEHREWPVIYCAFDCLELDGKSIKELPLLERKTLLKKLLGKNSILRYSDHVVGNGKDFFKAATAKKLEGIMAKKSGSEYLPGVRTNSWLKIKNNHTADVAIAGFTTPAGSRQHFGALILATNVNGKWVHAGNAGTGFDTATIRELFAMLDPIRVKQNPLDVSPAIAGATWVKLKYCCEIKFTEWTKDGKMRHPVFLHLRPDKSINEIGMEKIVKSGKKNLQSKTASKKSLVRKSTPSKKVAAITNVKKDSAGEEESSLKFGRITVPVTNRQKIYFKKDGVTKGDVIDYYQDVAEYLLPYLKNRPQSLNRMPNGIDAQGFYQKDAGDNIPEWIKTFGVYSESSKRTVDYIICNDKATLAYMNNLGCIELNPWHSVINRQDKPDYLIIDLDPSAKNTFDDVVETALCVKDILDKAGAESYIKTSGGTGLHVYVPMGRKYIYEQVKNFAHIVCMMVEDELPKITTLERNLKKRDNKKIYLDYLQNSKGQTIASIYCLRPKNGAPVSMPLHWKEVKKGLSPLDFNIHNALKRIKKNGDIFKGVVGPGVNLVACLKRINPANGEE